MKIAMPMNRIATTADMPATAAQISVVTSERVSTLTVDTSLSSECARLSQQFDQAETAHKTDKNYTQALAISTEGKTFGSSNKQAAGIQYLGSAIKMIGIKPNI